ncbi:cellulose binding domain-containing protein [Micromonospora rifamycinica]|uniref:cellulose binding domain-containing protein n=1 Tax=Micromonospora rifamycinica TaxID=291594 RepID=UPI003F54F3CD
MRFPPRDTTPQPTTAPPTTPPPTTPPPTTPPPTTPPPTTQPPPTTPPGTPPPVSCRVVWQPNQWSGGFTAEVSITNLGAPVTSWTLTWSFTADQRITNAWNAQVTQSGAAVTARNATWNGTVPQSATVSFGVQGTFGSGNPRPAAFQFNGGTCLAQ